MTTMTEPETIDCPACGGEGSLMCGSCSGQGRSEFWGHIKSCHACGNQGGFSCGTCNESGEISKLKRCTGCGETAGFEDQDPDEVPKNYPNDQWIDAICEDCDRTFVIKHYVVHNAWYAINEALEHLGPEWIKDHKDLFKSWRKAQGGLDKAYPIPSRSTA